MNHDDQELFDSYKAKVKENILAKIPFGEHQEKAFESVVIQEVLKLKAENSELRKLVPEAFEVGKRRGFGIGYKQWVLIHPILKEGK